MRLTLLTRLLTGLSLALVLLASVNLASATTVQAALAPTPEELAEQEAQSSVPTVGDRLTQNQPQPPNNSTEFDFLAGPASGCDGITNIISHPGCLLNMVVNTIGLVFILLAMLIGAIVDWVLFIVLWVIQNIIALNPTEQGSAFFNLAVQAYAITVSIANLLILFAFFYVGYRYLFGLQDKKVGWQEFLIKVIAATILVNFSIFLVSIFVSLLHGIGQLFVNIFVQGGGDIGGAYQLAIKKAGGYDSTPWNTTVFSNIFAEIDDYWSGVVVQLLYPIIGIFIIMELFKLVKIVITRFVLLFFLLVLSPIGIVCYFSPVEVFQKAGKEWLKQLWIQTSIYPIFVIALAIGGVFIVGFVDAAEAEGFGDVNENFIRILALFVAYGVIKVMVDFFEKQFKGLAEGVWRQMGTAAMAVGGTLGAAGAVGLSALRGAGKGISSGRQMGQNLGGRVTSGNSFGSKMLRAGTGTLGAVTGGVLHGAATGAKTAINPMALAQGARRGAFAFGSAADFLGNDSIKRASDSSKFMRAAMERSSTEAGHLSNAAIRLAPMTAGLANQYLRETVPKYAQLDDWVDGKIGKDYAQAKGAATGWLKSQGLMPDFMTLASDFADTLGNTKFSGQTGADIVSFGSAYNRSIAAGVDAQRKVLGIDPRLTSGNVKRRLNNILDQSPDGNYAGSYLRNKAQGKEILDELKQRPSLVNELDGRQKKWLQDNYHDIANDDKEWQEKVETNYGHLGDANARRAFGARMNELDKNSDQWRNIDRGTYEDDDVIEGFREAGGDMKLLGQKAGKDFTSFRGAQNRSSNVTLNTPDAQAVANRSATNVANRGRSDAAQSTHMKVMESKLAARMRAQGGKTIDEATDDDIRQASIDASADAIKSQFFADDGKNNKEAEYNNANTAEGVKKALSGSGTGRKHIEIWEAEKGRKMEDGDVSEFKNSYEDVRQKALGALSDSGNDVHDDNVDEYYKNSDKYKRAREQADRDVQKSIRDNLAGGGGGAQTPAPTPIYGPQGQQVSSVPAPGIPGPGGSATPSGGGGGGGSGPAGGTQTPQGGSGGSGSSGPAGGSGGSATPSGGGGGGGSGPVGGGGASGRAAPGGGSANVQPVNVTSLGNVTLSQGALQNFAAALSNIPPRPPQRDVTQQPAGSARAQAIKQNFENTKHFVNAVNAQASQVRAALANEKKYTQSQINEIFKDYDKVMSDIAAMGDNIDNDAAMQLREELNRIVNNKLSGGSGSAGNPQNPPAP